MYLYIPTDLYPCAGYFYLECRPKPEETSLSWNEGAESLDFRTHSKPQYTEVAIHMQLNEH